MSTFTLYHIVTVYLITIFAFSYNTLFGIQRKMNIHQKAPLEAVLEKMLSPSTDDAIFYFCDVISDMAHILA